LAADEKQILKLLESGLKKGGYTHSIRDILEALQTGKMQAFLNDMNMKSKLVEFAKEQNCTMGRAFVRPGLVVPMEQAGWRKAQTVMFFDLES